LRLKFWNKIPHSPEEKKTKNNERVLCIISGLFLGLSFPPIPFPATLLIFVGLIPYFFVLEKKEKLVDINRATYLTAFIFNLITIYWVGSWQSETDPFLMIAGAVLLFFNPILFLIPSTLFYLAQKIFNKKIAFYLLPFFWVTYEYLYMITDASFPWLTLSNGLPYFLTFIQIADIIGSLGLSLLVVLINLFIFQILKEVLSYREKKDRSIKKLLFTSTFTFILILFPIIYGVVTISNFKLPEKKIKVGLIQPNINPWEKWNPGGLWNMANIYFDLSVKAVEKKAEILFWPETAFPIYLLDGSHQDLVDSIYNFINHNHVYLITGMPDFKFYGNKNAPPDSKYNKLNDYYYTIYNGILFFSPESKRVGHYGKMKLVPFGERVPFVDALPFLGDLIKWQVGISGWNKGRDTVVFRLLPLKNIHSEIRDTIKINSLVCFESVYPAFVAQFVQKGAQLISVVTNDSWYGNSSGPYQHKEIAVLRAVENRRTVVRAANGGISCIIDPLGNTVTETKMYTKDFIAGDVWLENEKTFFTCNPFIIPVVCSIISFFVIGIFLIWKLKIFLKL
jgi:apolipoprotein N-acyltransferase